MNYNSDPVGSPSFQFPPRRTDLKTIADQAMQAIKGQSTGELTDIGAGLGSQVGAELVPDGFWARLTGSIGGGVALYSFYENQDDGSGGGWTPSNGAAQSNNSPSRQYNAYEINNNAWIPVPGAPYGLVGNPPGESFYYVVAAIWIDNKTGVSLQSDVSNEIGTSGFGVLAWSAPPAPIVGYTLSQFAIWRTSTANPGQENTLIALLPADILTYTDTGTGTPDNYPILGGTAGPLVWMSPRSVDGFYKFQHEPPPPAWIQVTNATPMTISLPGGNTLIAYQAQRMDLALGVWVVVVNGTAWYTGVNTEAPQPGMRFQCRFVGVDTTTPTPIPIWASESMQAAIALITSPSPDPTTGLYQAVLQYYVPSTQTWISGQAIKLRDANQ